MEVSRKVVKTNLILQQVKVATSKSMNFTNFDEKVDKIIKSCQRAFEKLLAEKKLLDGELVFADEEGKPEIVRARESEAIRILTSFTKNGRRK